MRAAIVRILGRVAEERSVEEEWGALEISRRLLALTPRWFTGKVRGEKVEQDCG